MSDGYARFMILGQGRTGSTMLVQALNSHAEILCFGEIFNFGDVYNPNPPRVRFDVDGYSTDEDGDRMLRNDDFKAFLQKRIFCAHEASVRAVGFKFHYDHFWRYEGLPEHFSDDVGLRVIHLRRRNHLRTLVSLKIAEQSGRWVERSYAPEPSLTSRARVPTLVKAARSPGKALAAVRRKLKARQATERASASVEVAPEELREFQARTVASGEHWTRLLNRHATIDIEYEDLARNRDVIVAEVERFLGVEPAPPVVSLRRQNPEPLRELITNYDELRAAFVRTPERAFFDG